MCIIRGVTSCETELSGPGGIPLSGPLSIQVTAIDKALVVQWTKVAPARGITPTYKLHWSAASKPEGSNSIFVDTDPSSNLIKETITGLTNHQTYYVWVIADFGDLGKSDFRDPTVGIPIPPPQTPGTITPYPGHQMLELGWAKVADAFTYEVYYISGTSTDSEPPSGVEMKTVSDPEVGLVAGVVLHGLSDGTLYTMWVRATNTAGVSGYRTISDTPATDNSTPAEPATITAAGGDRKITVTWDQVPGVPEYRLYYSTTNNFSSATEWPKEVLSNAPMNSADITGLSNDKTYYVWVVSSNGAGSLSPPPHPSASAETKAKPAIQFNDSRFVLGKASAEYAFAQDLPKSVFFPDGRPGTDRLSRVQESALGNLFADGAAWYLRNKQGKTFDFVFLNGGYIDNGILRGDITVGSVAGIVDPDARNADKFVIVTMTGENLKELFYRAASEESYIKWIGNDVDPRSDVAGVSHTGRGSLNTGFFGVVSKEVQYTLEYPHSPTTGTLTSEQSAPYYRGRIKPNTLKLNGADIVDGDLYRIATSDYLATGNYFTGLITGRSDIELIDVLFWRGVAAYIYDQGTVTPKLDGRIKIEGGVPLPPPWVNSSWTPDWLK
jgi:hypothetical protein